MGAFERIKEEFGGYSDASASKNNHWLAVMECLAGGRGGGFDGKNEFASQAFVGVKQRNYAIPFNLILLSCPFVTQNIQPVERKYPSC